MSDIMLKKNTWDMVKVDKMLKEYFGEVYILDTMMKLAEYFNTPVTDTKKYFEMLDARVAELKQVGGGEEMIELQRQECFILANNFESEDQRPSDAYLSRMVSPFV